MAGVILPHSDEAERALIASVLVGSDATFDNVAELVDADAFYHGRHRDVWAAIESVRATGMTPDIVTVGIALRERKKIGSQPGQIPPAFLMEITGPDHHFLAARAKQYAAKVRERAMQRAQYRFAQELAARAADDASDPFATLEFIEAECAKLQRRPTGSTAYDYATMFPDVLKEIERRAALEAKIAGMESGLNALDTALSGFQRGDNVVLAARPAMGKTALGLEIAEGMAQHGNAGLIISLEMSAMSLAMRSLSRHGHVDAENIRGGNLRDGEWRRITEAAARLSRLGVVIEDGSSLSIAQMDGLVARYRRSHDIAWVVLDYLQLGSAPGTRSRELEIGAISRAGKQIAKKHDVCWIALSQLNRDVESRGDKRPMLSDLRESGSIEQDADVVMFLYRPEYYDIPLDKDGNSTAGVAEVIIAKQRNGPTGTVKLTFVSEWIAFENWSPRDDDAPESLPPASWHHRD